MKLDLGGLVKFLSAQGDRKNCWVVVCYWESLPRLTLCYKNNYR